MAGADIIPDTVENASASAARMAEGLPDQFRMTDI